MSYATTAKTIGAGLVAVLVVTVLVSQVAVTASDAADEEGTGAAAISGGSGVVPLISGAAIEEHQGAQSTLGDQATLDGSTDAEIAADIDAATAGNQALCAWATPDSVSSHRAIAGYQYLELSYNGTSDKWRAYYYDEQTRSGYAATATPGNTATPTLLCGQVDRAGNRVELYENATEVAAANIDGGGVADAPPDTNWNGGLEEIRVFNDTVNASQQSEWLGEPVLSMDGAAPVARLMFDVRDRGASSVPVFFASGDATVGAGVTFTDGFSGPSISRGTDYSVGGLDNNVFSTLSGGVFDESGEVIYASFIYSQFGGVINRTVQIGQTALSLLVIGFVIKASAVVMRVFDDAGM